MSVAAATVATTREKGNSNEVLLSEEARWQPVLGLPCQITVDLSLPNFKVSDFLGLRSGSVLATCWGVARDVPLRMNGILFAWGELEGTGHRLAVRLTELA
jgi:flagellar motor switch/type III secretory pathway protein FliN